ncbi:MAG TPA: hypothetical protein VKU38_09330 [Ktedonobacteraceae bacterium]|nr:hypothetical protein [Ktedonobacteraceae bacterium]
MTKPAAWHTGTATDPWHWRDRFASEGNPAYGRCIGSRPILITHGIFPLVRCLLASSQTVKERDTARLLSRPTVQIYEIIGHHPGIEVRTLRKLAALQDTADKHAFDHALIDWQNTADIVISGVAENQHNQSINSGWNGTCSMLAERWMEQHRIKPLQLSSADATTQLFSWLRSRWEEQAVWYLHRKLAPFP